MVGGSVGKDCRELVKVKEGVWQEGVLLGLKSSIVFGVLGCGLWRVDSTESSGRDDNGINSASRRQQEILYESLDIMKGG